MEVYIRRLHREEKSTLGFLYTDDRKAECFTLEDGFKEIKVWGETRIPAGRYLLECRVSPHFGREMIYLKGVPNFTDVMIHSGNKVTDTNGCILVGDTPGIAKPDYIMNSSQALARIQPIITSAIKVSSVYITITDEDV